MKSMLKNKRIQFFLKKNKPFDQFYYKRLPVYFKVDSLKSFFFVAAVAKNLYVILCDCGIRLRASKF